MNEFWKKPWLWIPPTWAHELGPYALRVSSLFQSGEVPQWKSFQWKGLNFPNPLGLAGGVDKNAENVEDWWNHGAGFVEVGTVTPQPQKPNPGQIIRRDVNTHSLWNRMGFPSYGGSEVRANLNSLGTHRSPLFVNLGKNRHTPLHSSHQDYLQLIDLFHEVADVFVVNISSPNTQDLRQLQNKTYLQEFLQPLVKSSTQNYQKPLLLKLSPDESNESLKEMIETAVQSGVSGFVLTNTTTARISAVDYPREGGMSGEPLKKRALECLKLVHQVLGSRRSQFLLVSAGGVMTSEDVFERLHEGADLVEVYSALIFEGPGFFKRVARDWHGQKNPN